VRLIVECGRKHLHDCSGEIEIDDSDAILVALAEAGVLEEERNTLVGKSYKGLVETRYVSPWKETK
jgi:hypothetical protein